jgi:hypothetical protein
MLTKYSWSLKAGSPGAIMAYQKNKLQSIAWSRGGIAGSWRLTCGQGASPLSHGSLLSIHDGLTLSNTGHPEALKACSGAVEPHSKAVDTYLLYRVDSHPLKI